MTLNSRKLTILLTSAVLPLLSGCGADGVASPGEGGTFIINPTPTPTPTPTPSPTATPTPAVTPAASCPTIAGPDQLTDLGTITDGANTWRNCGFPSRFTATSQISKVAGIIYSLPGRVDVGTDQGAASTNTVVTLTIDPGVVVFGATGNSFLAVNRGNRIEAVGTATNPIIFTGRGNVTGAAGDQSSQLWGGIVLLGRAPITDCLAPGATPGTVACERDTEGTSNALYGGATATDNSGTMRYVQIRFSGFILSGNSELQGLTPSGTGSGTTLEYIHVHNSSDDGIEVFGGRANMKRLVVTGVEDDALDTDVGYKGAIQYVIAVHRDGGAVGDSMIEADSDNANDGQTPRQNTKLANFTFVQRATPANSATVLLRGGTDYTMLNGVISAPNSSCIRVSRANTMQAADATLDEAGPPIFHSVAMQCSATPFSGVNSVTAADVEAAFNAGTSNISTFTTTLTNVFVNGANETARTAVANIKTHAAYFDQVSYIGAVRDATDTWYAGWTCNSSTANFGSTSKSCSSIPTT
jgi:hypothetical protein